MIRNHDARKISISPNMPKSYYERNKVLNSYKVFNWTKKAENHALWHFAVPKLNKNQYINTFLICNELENHFLQNMYRKLLSTT